MTRWQASSVKCRCAPRAMRPASGITSDRFIDGRNHLDGFKRYHLEAEPMSQQDLGTRTFERKRAVLVRLLVVHEGNSPWGLWPNRSMIRAPFEAPPMSVFHPPAPPAVMRSAVGDQEGALKNGRP